MFLLLIALIKKAETEGERGEMEIYLHFFFI